MSLADLFRRIFGGRASVLQRQPEGATSVACAEPAPAEAAEPVEDGLLDELTEPGWWVPKGEPVLAPPSAARSADPADPLRAALERVLADPDLSLPLLPHVAQRALVLLHDKEVDYHALAKTIGDDPAIAAEVLRVVNSSAYARLFKVSQLETAFARLGCSTLRSILVAMTVKGIVIRTGGPVRTLGEEIWQRAIVSGVLVHELSRRYGLPDGEAFLVGLLHDIGNLALLRVLHDCQKQLGGTVSRALFDGLSEEWHERLGVRLAQAWRLPEPLPTLIGAHHARLARGDALANYRSLVQFADVVCSMLGYGAYVSYDFFALPCVQQLQMEDNEATRCWLTSLPALIMDRAGVF